MIRKNAPVSVRMLHLGDVHLGARCAFLGDESRIRDRQEDFRNAFAAAMDYAADPAREIRIVAVAGDLFDSATPAPGFVEYAAARFRDLRDRGVKVFVVPGTHDSYADIRSVYRQIDDTFGARVFRSPNMQAPVTIDVDSETVHVYGMAAQDGADMRPLGGFQPVDAPGYHVGIVHASLVDIRPDKTSLLDEPVVSKDEIGSCGLDYLALGHFHNFRRIEADGTVACYPGSTEGKKFGENGPRYAVIVELSSAGVAIEQIQTNRRTLCEIELEPSREQITSVGELLSWIETSAGSADIVRVRLTGATDFTVDPSVVSAGFDDRYFYFELIDESSIIKSERVRKVSAERTVRGLFTRKMLAAIARADSPADVAVTERALRIGLVEMGFSENENVD